MHRQQMKLKISFFVHCVQGLNLQHLAPPSHIPFKTILQNQKQWNYEIYSMIYVRMYWVSLVTQLGTFTAWTDVRSRTCRIFDKTSRSEEGCDKFLELLLYIRICHELNKIKIGLDFWFKNDTQKCVSFMQNKYGEPAKCVTWQA